MKNAIHFKPLPAALAALAGLALTVASAYADYRATVLTDNPSGYWRLDESSGTAAVNSGSLGTTGNGTYTGATVLGQLGALVGDTDTAAGFNGGNGYVNIPFNTALNPTIFTLECWARPSTAAFGDYVGAFSSRVNSTFRGFTFYALPNATQGAWQLWTGSGSAWNTQTGPLIKSNEWTHLVATYDGSNQCFYVDGALYARSRLTVLPNTGNPMRIGAAGSSTPAYYFKTNIDEVAVYTTALSRDRVLAHYVAARGSNPPPVAPLIVTAPQSLTTFVSQSSTFSVYSTGSLPFTNQWMYLGADGLAPPANVYTATGETFVITNTALTNAGYYQVEVYNNGGSVTSAVVQLTVLDIQTPTFAPQPQALTLYPGTTAHFVSGATGGGNIGYQWLFYGTNLPTATNATLVITNVQAANQGNYQLRATNEAGTAFSDLVGLTLLAAPATNSYAGYVLADQPVAYWRLDETSGSFTAIDRAGGFNGLYDGPVQLEEPGAISGDSDKSALFGLGSTRVGVPYNAAINPSPFTIECWVLDNATVTNDYRSPLTSRQDDPRQGFTIYAASNNRWQLWSGTGSSWDVISGPPVQFSNWTHLVATYDGSTRSLYVNGVLAGTSTATYLANPLNAFKIGAGGGVSDAYYFFGSIDEVAVYNQALSADRVSAHYAMGLGATTPPTITVPPVSGSVLAGSNITLTVQATGSLPLSYQWQFYSTNLPGRTATSLTIQNVQTANSGPYRVVVNNPAGVRTSSVAVVTTVMPTDNYSSVVLADGPAGYWRLNDTNGSIIALNFGLLGAVADGTATNVVFGLPGVIADGDTCANFTATNGSAVDVPYAPQFNGPEFTAECWARMTGPGNDADEGFQSPLTSRDGTSAGYIFYGLYGATWQLWTGTGGGTMDKIIGPSIQLGSWTHLAATYDGITRCFYVNGVLVGSSAAPFAADVGTLLRIGAGRTEVTPGAYFFNGDIDEVAVYNQALAAASIQAHYVIGAPTPTLSIQRTPTTVLLNWSGGTLQQSTELPGTWSDVITNSPLDLGPMPSGTAFYRVKR